MQYQCPNCHVITDNDYCAQCDMPAMPMPEPAAVPPANADVNANADANANVNANVELNFANEGLERLKHCIQQRYALFLLIGVSRAGKTQIIRAFYDTSQQDGQLFSHLPGLGVLPSNPRTINIYPIKKDLIGRKAAFVDTAGEHFEYTFVTYGRDENDYPLALSLLRLLAKNIAGVVAVVDLTREWLPLDKDISKQYAQQQRIIVAGVLKLLRWFRYCDQKPNDFPTPPTVTEDLARMGKQHRLKFPVLILFSK